MRSGVDALPGQNAARLGSCPDCRPDARDFCHLISPDYLVVSEPARREWSRRRLDCRLKIRRGPQMQLLDHRRGLGVSCRKHRRRQRIRSRSLSVGMLHSPARIALIRSRNSPSTSRSI